MTDRAPAARLGAGRAAGILLRTAHLGAMAVLLGAAAFDAPPHLLRAWFIATGATGAALLVSEASHSRNWGVQVRGVMVMTHVGAAALVHTGAGLAALAVALVIGASGSHLPKGVRKWSFRHRAVVD